MQRGYVEPRSAGSVVVIGSSRSPNPFGRPATGLSPRPRQCVSPTRRVRPAPDCGARPRPRPWRTPGAAPADFPADLRHHCRGYLRRRGVAAPTNQKRAPAAGSDAVAVALTAARASDLGGPPAASCADGGPLPPRPHRPGQPPMSTWWWVVPVAGSVPSSSVSKPVPFGCPSGGLRVAFAPPAGGCAGRGRKATRGWSGRH
jgi:hypothetical protein